MFWAYKLIPYVEEEKKDKAQYDERLQSLESKVDNLLKELKGE
nr:MAG TPA: Intermediate conductance calcium-activated potassium channel-helix bundle, copper, MEMBRANE PROTEIN [Caudoviricetes sp.]